MKKITVLAIAMLTASVLMMPAMPVLAKPNVITIIVKENSNTPVTYSVQLQIYDPNNFGEPNWLWAGGTDNNGKLVLVNGVDVHLVWGIRYLIVLTDFGVIGYLKVSRAGNAHVTVYTETVLF